MRTYVVAPRSEATGFSGVSPLSIDHRNWTAPIDVRAEARLCWDPTALYVHLRAWETEIRAEHTGRVDMVCEDSCLELFLRPVEDDLRYFNFEFNINCALYLGFGNCMRDLVRLLPEGADALFQPEAARLPDGWEIRYRIPVAFIERFFPGYTLSQGQRLRANLYKCGDLTSHPHFLSWNPMTSDTPQFHRPQDFGLLVLG